jgi:hypothetical protein
MIYSFALFLEGISDITEEQADKLFESGCNDCTPGISAGVASIEFDREAPSWAEAVGTATKSVSEVFPNAKVVKGAYVSNGLAKMGDHVQYDTNEYQWDKSKPIDATNQPRPTGSVIRACGRVVDVYENRYLNPEGGIVVLVESGMDRVAMAPEKYELTPYHAPGSMLHISVPERASGNLPAEKHQEGEECS